MFQFLNSGAILLDILMEPFATCICKVKIPSSHPYCLENRNCLEFIIEGVTYLFDGSVTKNQIESFVKNLPININKQLMSKEPFDITTLDEDLRNKILNSEIIPIDFLLPTIVQNFPIKLQELQKNKKLIEFGKEIRKRNFSKKTIEKLSRLAFYFSIFFYESRNHPIWKVVLDSLVKAPYTPEILLQYLDTLFRRDASEYLRFHSILSQNSSLTRIIYLIDAMISQSTDQSTQNNTQTSESEAEEIMSIPQLNHYAHHWFPGICVTALKHPDIYKTTLEKTYEELYQWKDLYQSVDQFSKFTLYQDQPTNPQTINPLTNKILIAILSHEKVSSKILAKEVNNNNPSIRKTIVLSPNITVSTLEHLQEDPDDYIRKIALFRLNVMKKEKEIAKNSTEENTNDNTAIKAVLAPNHVDDIFKDFPDTQYY